MQGLSPRQTEIVKLARGTGRVTVDDLVTRFEVTPQTIRRDIKELSRRDLLQRYHGGAGLPPGSDRLAYPNRRVRNASIVLSSIATAEALSSAPGVWWNVS